MAVDFRRNGNRTPRSAVGAAAAPTPPLLPSILPPLTKEIRDEYSKHVELSKETAAKTKKNSIPKNPFWGVPALLCILLVFFAIAVVAYAVAFQHNPIEPPYRTPLPTPVPEE